MRAIVESPKKWVIEANPDQQDELGALPVETMKTLYPEFFYYGSNPQRAYDVINVLLVVTVSASPQLMRQKFIDDWKPLNSAIEKLFNENNTLIKNVGVLRFPNKVESSVKQKMSWLINTGMLAVPALGVAGFRMFCYYAFFKDPLIATKLAPAEETDMTLFLYLTLIEPELGKIFLPAAQVDELNVKFEEFKEIQQTVDYEEVRSKLPEHQMWDWILRF